MHLCFVSREYPPNSMGGIGTYVMNMTRLLVEAGHTVTVLTQWCAEAPTRGIENPHTTVEGRLRIFYLPFVNERWELESEVRGEAVEALVGRDLVAAFAWVVANALDQILPESGIELIEAPEYEAPLLIFQGRRMGLSSQHPFRKIPTVVHLHSPSHLIFLHNDDEIANHWVTSRRNHERLSVLLADGVLSPSAYLADQVAAWSGRARSSIKVMPYPVGPLLPVPRGIQRVRGRVLHVGRVEPRKGVFEFIEAACRLAAINPEVSFRFVGGPHHRLGYEELGETAGLLVRLIPENLRERFDFAGKVPRDTLGAEYAAAEWAVVPSRWDNYPNTCVEAMSCGTPVVASDRGGMAEMIRDGEEGFLANVEEGDRAALVDALERTLRKALASGAEATEHMGATARCRILKLCDDAEIVAKHEQWYAQLVKRQHLQERRVPSLGVGVWVAPGEDAREGIDRSRKLSQSADGMDEIVIFSCETLLPDSGLEERSRHIRCERVDQGLRLPSAGDLAMGTDLVAWLPAGARLCADAIERVRQVFANHEDAGFCLGWRRLPDGRLDATLLAESVDLIAPDQYPVYPVFRVAAVEASGGFSGTGIFLEDRLRDLCLRILSHGWRSAYLPECIIQLDRLSDCPIVGCYGFIRRRDSVREVATAHRSILWDNPFAMHSWLRSEAKPEGIF